MDVKRIVRSTGTQLRRATDAERFVRLIVGGGIVLVAGLWIATLSNAWSPSWVVGAALVGIGVGGLAAGIRSEIEY